MQSQVLVAVRRTFVTPFDRTDIQSLITSMDDSIDQMNKTAKTIVLSGLPGARGRQCTDGQLHRDLEGAHHKSRVAPGIAEAATA
jgi:hypothetical protein